MSDTLRITHPPDHSYIIIAVPGERLNGKPVSDYKFLESNKQKFKIIDRVEILRQEPIPTVLILMATGQFLTTEDVYSHYPKSVNLNFFLCQKTDSNTKS